MTAESQPTDVTRSEAPTAEAVCVTCGGEREIVQVMIHRSDGTVERDMMPCPDCEPREEPEAVNTWGFESESDLEREWLAYSESSDVRYASDGAAMEHFASGWARAMLVAAEPASRDALDELATIIHGEEPEADAVAAARTFLFAELEAWRRGERWPDSVHDALDILIAAARASAGDEELRDILAEVDRAAERFGEWSTSGHTMTDAERYLVLSEEVGEVAEALVLCIEGGRFNEDRPGHAEDLRHELRQVAAVCIGWLRALAPSPEESGE